MSTLGYDSFSSEEDLKYNEIKEAMAEEERLQERVNKIFETVSDRARAEEIILRDWASDLDAAQHRTGMLLREWFRIIELNHQREEEELTGDEEV